MQPTFGAEIVVRTLESLGVEQMFGIPGIHNLDLYDALLESPIRHITARHEQGAGFMADGYARSSGNIGVALVISGPGLTNILTPMAQAFHDSIPLVVMSSQIPSTFLDQRTGFLHELRNSTIMASSVAKESRRVLAADDIEPYLTQAFRLAHTGRPGPVHIEIPFDILHQPGTCSASRQKSASPQESHPPERSGIAQTRIADALNLLHTAQRPVLILGGGATEAGPQITQLAERVNAVVLETCAGKGVVDERHPLCLGTRLHFPKVREYLQQADVILALGTELSPTDLWECPFTTNGSLIQVDHDPANFIRNGRADIGIVGDVKQVALTLLDHLDRGKTGSPDAHTDDLDALKTYPQSLIAEITGIGDDLPLMVDMLNVLRAALPDDAILSTDMTSPAYVGLSEFPAYQPRTFLHPIGYGTLGYALPAAIGAKVAHPERVVCVLAGDGGFQFTLPELAVACQENLAFPLLIWNDQGFGEIRRHEEHRHPGRRIAVDHQPPDFQDLARAYQIPATTVTQAAELNIALHQALEHTTSPFLIEIRTAKGVE
ncbi:5-guanidino-2-oxopentanoate decarboxylase [candidate division KSB3 bacterium]|uniref:5-guanidino-2-oxopentanoate decarboxylase n=1 Tax=candidate division KSB3 bacterium TaxID=2044937 RepID=A0A9D5JRQ3_9BACT|nr:5-guanidino-2-oxopentanoate decarboxylase [candidate division KSB3 bacterium]MBD3323027.1 5-guanidino-2-oxopentanoate decarboxylase [candidate division KSB3 bacterium]